MFEGVGLNNTSVNMGKLSTLMGVIARQDNNKYLINSTKSSVFLSIIPYLLHPDSMLQQVMKSTDGFFPMYS